MQENWNNPKTRRVFRGHLIMFVVAAIVMWVVWWLSPEKSSPENSNRFPWPVWPTFLWIMVLIIHYRAVYGKRKMLPSDYKRTKMKNSNGQNNRI